MAAPSIEPVTLHTRAEFLTEIGAYPVAGRFAVVGFVSAGVYNWRRHRLIARVIPKGRGEHGRCSRPVLGRKILAGAVVQPDSAIGTVDDRQPPRVRAERGTELRRPYGRAPGDRAQQCKGVVALAGNAALFLAKGACVAVVAEFKAAALSNPSLQRAQDHLPLIARRRCRGLCLCVHVQSSLLLSHHSGLHPPTRMQGATLGRESLRTAARVCRRVILNLNGSISVQAR